MKRPQSYMTRLNVDSVGVTGIGVRRFAAGEVPGI